MKLIVKFAEFDNIQLGTLNNQIVLTLTKQTSSIYLSIPTCLKYSIYSDIIEISCNSKQIADISIFNTFKNTFNTFNISMQSLLKKKILLKGLGFRSIFDTSTKIISFKLGYSHLTNLSVPDYIKQIKIKKNIILFESSDKILLGNFVKKIHKLRESDSYKGKGFSYPYNTTKLKAIKKK
jgi:ribosomal protein L6P/L9E